MLKKNSVKLIYSALKKLGITFKIIEKKTIGQTEIVWQMNTPTGKESNSLFRAK